jgi:hypothetical protein
MTVAKTLPPWKPPRPKPELQPAKSEHAREYMSWFVNRLAYNFSVVGVEARYHPTAT